MGIVEHMKRTDGENMAGAGEGRKRKKECAARAGEMARSRPWWVCRTDLDLDAFTTTHILSLLKAVSEESWLISALG